MNKFIERLRGRWGGMVSEGVREGERPRDESSMESQMVVGRVEQGQRGEGGIKKSLKLLGEPLYYKYHL